MKRNYVYSHQSYGPPEDAKLAHKYYSLLEDYLDLQKECVSKKRKLRVEKLNREILEDEVRFLRQRHAFLTKLQMDDEKERNCIANMTSIQEESNGKEELVGKTPTTTDKPPNFSIYEKKSGKKKVSWNDNVVVIEI